MRSKLMVGLAVMVMAMVVAGWGRDAFAQAGVNIALVSFKGELDIDEKKVEKTYRGFGEIRNQSGFDVSGLRGRAILYWKGTSVATDDVDFYVVTDMKAGEVVPFYLSVDLNYFIDVDDVKFTFEATRSANPIYLPPLTFSEHLVATQGRRIVGKVTNRGPESVEEPLAIITYYDAAGRVVDIEYVGVLDRASFADREKGRPALNAGWGIDILAVAFWDVSSSYKVFFRGKPSTQVSQLLTVTNVQITGGGTSRAKITGTVTNPSDRTVTQAQFVITALNPQGKPVWVDDGFLYEVVGGNYRPLPLAPGQTRSFSVDALFPYGETVSSVSVVAVSTDRYAGTVQFPTPQPTPQPVPTRSTTANCRLFQETGKKVCEQFLAYWDKNGGLPQQGFPISEEMAEVSDTDGKTYLVQYFERAVFEHHPENVGKSSEVLLSLLGNFLYKQKYPNGAPNQKVSTDNPYKFNETGKTLGGKFREYWEKNGGLAQQGYPITDEFEEKSELDGKTYRVQYFERAVFEWHPEQTDPKYQVLLSQLGTFRYKQKYGNTRP